MFKPEKGCILVFHANKSATKAKIGVYDFNGKEIIPISIKMKNSITEPDKNVWEHYDELPAEVKKEMIEIYKQKKAEFNAKMGR